MRIRPTKKRRNPLQGCSINMQFSFASDLDDAAHKDKNDGWWWNVGDQRKLGIIAIETLDGMLYIVKTYLPAGRKVSEFWGALANPEPATPTLPADATSLGPDGEVSAFQWLTTAKPIWLLIMLHEQGQANIAPRYFSLDRFDLPVKYNEHDEDSDAVVLNAAGVGQHRLSNVDHTFEERIYKLHDRKQRQSCTKKYLKGCDKVTTDPPKSTCTIQNYPRICYMSKEYLIISIARYQKILHVAVILQSAVQLDNGDIACWVQGYRNSIRMCSCSYSSSLV